LGIFDFYSTAMKLRNQRTRQTRVAEYRYDPYGRSLYTYDSLPSGGNRYRFSSKELVTSGNLYYYGYRFYDPNLQRWLNRDPIESSINLYRFVINEPIGMHDSYGLKTETADDPINAEALKACNKAVKEMNKKRPEIEHCGMICMKCENGEVKTTNTMTSGIDMSFFPNAKTPSGKRQTGGCTPQTAPCPAGWEPAAMYHTHPVNPWFTDPEDYIAADKANLIFFVCSGVSQKCQTMYKYYPNTNPHKVNKCKCKL
jgi:RHS repeat-associated protein